MTSTYDESLQHMEELFGRDSQLALATCVHMIPSIRMVDVYYENGAFYIVTNADSQKVKELMDNPHVALCKDMMRFQGLAQNLGHPLKKENKDLRDTLIQVFSKWYFKHNKEDDDRMCIVKIRVLRGFIYVDGIGYQIDMEHQQAESFPFVYDIVAV